ncbi:MAG: glutathione peroxidase [Pseudomonadota bacterium]
MMRLYRRCVLTGLMAFLFGGVAPKAEASAENWTFDSMDGGTMSFDDWQGRPVLVVNTASRCGFTKQYDALQKLHETYEDQGLVVLVVPSGDFRQELASNEEVKDYCEVNFGLTMPMATITSVLGDQAHPFYRWMKRSAGWSPNWNFNKVLIAPDRTVAGTWRATTRPNARVILSKIEAHL